VQRSQRVQCIGEDLEGARSENLPECRGVTEYVAGSGRHSELLEDAAGEFGVVPLSLFQWGYRRIRRVVKLEDIVEHLMLPRSRSEPPSLEVLREHAASASTVAMEYERVEEIEGDGLNGI
jgi:hypothetical protein